MGLKLKSSGPEVKEQKDYSNGWHEKFQSYLEQRQFEKARAYAERKEVLKPLICEASFDFFRNLFFQGRKRDYRRMIRAFEGYRFEDWLDYFKREQKRTTITLINQKEDRKVGDKKDEQYR